MALEATGGHEFEAALALQAAGLQVTAVNPGRRGTLPAPWGALAKTDALDARMLAEFARVLHQPPHRQRFVKPLADAELQRLHALVLHRHQLVQMLTGERQRLHPAPAAAHPSIERVIAFLKTELADSDAEVAADGEHHHAALAQALTGVSGVGATGLLHGSPA